MARRVGRHRLSSVIPRWGASMIEGIEPFYQQIADAIQPALPPTWYRVWMDAIYYSDSMFYHAAYQTHEGTCLSLPASMAAENAFDGMRALFARSGKIPWGRARFVIFSTGKFNLQLSYDDCDESGFARFDEAAERQWRQRLMAGEPVPLLGAKPRQSGEG